MAWDFETEPEFEEKLAWMRQLLEEEIYPLEGLPPKIRKDREIIDQITAPLKDRVKEQGLWATHLPPELGGLGFGQVKLGLMNEILGKSAFAPRIFGVERTRHRQRRTSGRGRHR